MSAPDIPADLSRKFSKIDEEIFDHQSAIVRLRRDKIARGKNAILSCSSCRKRAPLGRWEFIQEHWYERPHSCTEGDSWNFSGTSLCHLVCPLCKAENYIHTHADRGKILFILVANKIDPETIFATIWDRFGKGATPEKRADRRKREQAMRDD